MGEPLTIEGITKRFGDMVAVDAVDLEIASGPVTGIIGPNGAGKTTLVHLLTGHLQPDAGRIRLGTRDVTRLEPHDRVRWGLSRTFQVVDIFPGLTVFQNVQMARITRAGGNLRFFRRAASEHAEEVERGLNEVGLWEFRERKGEQLSHGQQRRLELAITLATEPELCFLDEPTSGVSPHERDQMVELIRELAGQRQTTFVVIEHDMELIFDLCERVVVMHRGAVLADGTPADIRENEEVKEIYLGEEA